METSVNRVSQSYFMKKYSSKFSQNSAKIDNKPDITQFISLGQIKYPIKIIFNFHNSGFDAIYNHTTFCISMMLRLQ